MIKCIRTPEDILKQITEEAQTVAETDEPFPGRTA